MAGQPFWIGGPWTSQKLDILAQYLDKYTTAMKRGPFTLTYVDAFAGEGSWSPRTGYLLDDYGDLRGLRQGSPRIALDVDNKPFDRLLFIEADPERSESLRGLRQEFPERAIEVVNDDANVVLPRFCAGMKPLDRAVVFLDPFATEVIWATVAAIAKTAKVDCWVLFPRMAIARMMKISGEPSEALARRLDEIFGGREYWQDLYQPSLQLPFDGEPKQERQPGSEMIAGRYRERLESAFVAVAPTSRTLTNSKKAPMFDLFFAASNPAGAGPAIRIADHLLKWWGSTHRD